MSNLSEDINGIYTDDDGSGFSITPSGDLSYGGIPVGSIELDGDRTYMDERRLDFVARGLDVEGKGEYAMRPIFLRSSIASSRGRTYTEAQYAEAFDLPRAAAAPMFEVVGELTYDADTDTLR